MGKATLAGLLSASLLVGVNAQAADYNMPNVRFNGFASFGAAVLDTDEATLKGIDDSVSFKEDSLFALQVMAPLSDKLRVTGQFISRGSEDWDTEIAWGYVSYDLSDQLLLRAGRLRIPYYLLSDFLEVGYTYHWVRPPLEVYDSFPFNELDGIDLLYSFQMGSWDSSVQGYYGRLKDAQDTVGRDLRDMWGTAFTFGPSWLDVRLGHHEGTLDIGLENAPPFDGLFATLAGAGYQNVVDRLAIDDVAVEFNTVGARLTHPSIVAMAEWSELTFDKGLFQDISGWYATFGYRFGSLLPHITYAQQRSDVKTGYTDGLPPSVLVPSGPPPAPSIPASAFITSLVTETFSQEQDSITVGLRWDFHSSAALKFEVQQIEPKGTTSGKFTPNTPGTVYQDETTLVSAAVDVVF